MSISVPHTFFEVCLVIYFAIQFPTGGVSLAVRKLEVPSHVEVGDSPRLSCSFELGESRLYSLKWYKDDHEFCRYMPRTSPHSQVFPLPGLQIQENECTIDGVQLPPLSVENSGQYKCEVSTEGPSFRTVVSSRNLSVIAYPKGDPAITGVHSKYSVGDYISANCTASPSYPPPSLKWFINNVPAESYTLYQYPLMENPVGMFWTSLALRFKAERHHFKEPNTVVQLRCVEIVGDLPPWEAVALPQLANLPNQTVMARTTQQSSGASSKLQPSLLFNLTTFTWIWHCFSSRKD